MIDKIVEGTFPVTVEGKKLDTDAVLIDGSTYLPVRAFSEAVGYDVTFDAKIGVSLEAKKVPLSQGKTLEDIDNEISSIKSDIFSNDANIRNIERGIKENPSQEANLRKQIDDISMRTDKFKAMIQELEQQKATLTQSP